MEPQAQQAAAAGTRSSSSRRLRTRTPVHSVTGEKEKLQLADKVRHAAHARDQGGRCGCPTR